MKIILLENVPKVGKAGEVLEVAAGFGRNYLIPNKLAIAATEKSLGHLEHHRKIIQAKESRRLKDAHAFKERIEALSITIPCKVGESDRLFGSVTSMDIAHALRSKEVEVDKRAIKLEEPLKVLGVYTVPIHLEKGIVASLKVWLVKE